MSASILLVLFICILFLCFVWKREGYNQYDTLYQAYTVPYKDLTFIAAGERPALGHYLRIDDDTEFSPLANAYIDDTLKNNPCNRCMVHCLNPTTLLYGDEALGLCENFCKKDCKDMDLGMLEDAFMESRYQLRHDKNHEHYQNIPTSYYEQGGWEDYPSWFST